MSNLFELLFRAREIDEEIEQIDFKELGFVWSEIKTKTDNIFDYISKLESESIRLKDIAKEYQDTAKSYQKRADSLLEYVKNSMLDNSTDVLKGDRFEFKIQQRKGYEYPNQVTDGNIKNHSKYIRKKYEWDKIALKEAYKDGKVKKLVTEKTTVFLKKGINKS